MTNRMAGIATGTALLCVLGGAPSALAAQAPRVREQTSGSRALLQTVDAVDPQTVWTSGSGGTVLRTIDAGNSWQQTPVPGASRLQFRGLHAASADEAWILSAGNGGDSRIYHTTDGGSSWTLQFTNADSAAFYDCLTFFDRRHGVAFSDASHGRTNILRTSDGGASWALLPAAAVPAPLPGEGAFAASNGCVVALDATHGIIAASEPGARIFATDDAGATWTVRADRTPFVHDSQAGITGVAFRGARHGVGVAARINSAMTRDSSAASFATTGDGGATWQLRPRPPVPGALSGVTIVPGITPPAVVVASYGGALATRDDGATWTTLTTHAYWAVAAAGSTAWLVGPGGRITRIDF
jgi:photosystem II stability/assembly factor-like uncharacterized protein